MRLPRARGPVSRAVIAALRSAETTARIEVPQVDDPLADEDLQLALWVLQELHYADFEDASDGTSGDPATDREWDPGLLAVRNVLAAMVERRLREATAARVQAAREAADSVPEQLFMMTKQGEGASLAGYVHRRADRDQYREYMAHRSVIALKESDAVAWVLPRLRSDAKTALAEMLYDEYGAGRPHRLHSRLYAQAMRGCGLDASYGHYADRVPAPTLAVDNVATLLGLRRRLRGAALGHFAAFEATSSLPCRRLAGGAERLGFPPEVTRYWDEHVEADAVHEQLAVRDACGSLAEEEPELADDILFGAASCLETEERFGAAVLGSFEAGQSSLREADR